MMYYCSQGQVFIHQMFIICMASSRVRGPRGTLIGGYSLLSRVQFRIWLSKQRQKYLLSSEKGAESKTGS